MPNVVEVRRFQVTDHFCLAASRDGKSVGVEDESENPIRNERNCRGYHLALFCRSISTSKVQFLSYNKSGLF